MSRPASIQQGFPGPGAGKRPVGLQAIIAYKLAKAVFSTAVGAASLILLHSGTEAAAATLAQQLLDRSTREWALKLATLIVLAGTPHHAVLLAAGGFADAAVSLLEGLALLRGAWWAPWLVVAATGALLPWELAEAIHKPSVLRALLFAANLAVVVYLVRRAGLERSRSRAEAAQR